MEDYALVIASMGVIATVALLVWRVAAGPSHSTGGRLARLALALVLPSPSRGSAPTCS